MAKIKTGVSDSHKTRPKGISKHHFEKVYWPYLPLVLIISVLLVAGSAGGGLRDSLHHPFGKVLSYATSMSVGGLLADTNSARAANGAGALRLNDKLNAAAQAQADDMATRDYWSHDTPDGDPPWVWVTNQGYSYQALAKNLATGFSDEQNTVNGWMASPDHRTNMLNPIYSDVGFGYANNPNYAAAGGGPMTIVVAFYGEPQVLAASTTAPAPTHSTPAVSSPAVSSTAPPSSAAKPTSPAPTAKPITKTETKPDSTQNTAPVKSQTTSRLQLAAPEFSYGGLAAKLSLGAAIIIGLLWAGRHLRAVKKFLWEGERYAIRNPLTDLGIVIIACLLFILSQTAGLIQ